MKWEQTSVPGLQSVYLNLLPVLFKINQGVPFMVQGTGQAALVNWGDGFITDEATIQSYSGMSDANGFFQGIMTSPYLRQVSRLYLPMLFGPVWLVAALPCPALPALPSPGQLSDWQKCNAGRVGSPCVWPIRHTNHHKHSRHRPVEQVDSLLWWQVPWRLLLSRSVQPVHSCAGRVWVNFHPAA